MNLLELYITEEKLATWVQHEIDARALPLYLERDPHGIYWICSTAAAESGWRTLARAVLSAAFDFVYP